MAMSFSAVLPQSKLGLTDLITLLHLDILFDHFSVDTDGTDRIVSGPDMKSPVLLVQSRKISPYLFGTLVFECFHHVR